MSGTLSAYLKSAYTVAQKTPVVIRIHGRKYIVPYAYVLKYPNYLRAFLHDFFDCLQQDYYTYISYNQPLRYIRLGGHKLLVPYDLRYKNLSSDEIVERVFCRINRIYNKAVRLAFKLSEVYPDKPYAPFINLKNIENMQKAYYEFQLKNKRHEIEYITKRVSTFLQKNPVKVTHNIAAFSLENFMVGVRRWGIRIMLAAAVTVAVYNAVTDSE